MRKSESLSFLLDLIIFAKSVTRKWWSCVYSEEALKKIGNWIIDVANSGDCTAKKCLLSNLTNFLTADWKKDHKDSFEETVNLPSKLILNQCNLNFEGADNKKNKITN